MTELIFEIRDAEEGGYYAKTLGKPIFTQAETWEELKINVKEALATYFDSPEEQPKLVSLHYVRDEILLVNAA